MKQYGVLAAVFGGTLAVLLVAFLVFEQLGASGAAVVPSPSPSASPVAIVSARPNATRRPVPSASPTAVPSESAAASPTPADPTPVPTPRRSVTPATPAPTIAPGTTFDVVVAGKDYLRSDVPVNGKITKNPNGGITMTSDRTFSDTTSVNYKLPAGRIPPGTVITRLDTAICGRGSGDFWETYGPADAEPVEHEVTPPERDGCWHYLGGSGKDSTAHAIIQNRTTMTIDKVVYTITTK